MTTCFVLVLLSETFAWWVPARLLREPCFQVLGCFTSQIANYTRWRHTSDDKWSEIFPDSLVLHALHVISSMHRTLMMPLAALQTFPVVRIFRLFTITLASITTAQSAAPALISAAARPTLI